MREFNEKPLEEKSIHLTRLTTKVNHSFIHLMMSVWELVRPLFSSKHPHLFLCGIDSKTEIYEVYKSAIRIYNGHRQAVHDIDVNALGNQFVYNCYLVEALKHWNLKHALIALNRFALFKISTSAIFCDEF